MTDLANAVAAFEGMNDGDVGERGTPLIEIEAAGA